MVTFVFNSDNGFLIAALTWRPQRRECELWSRSARGSGGEVVSPAALRCSAPAHSQSHLADRFGMRVQLMGSRLALVVAILTGGLPARTFAFKILKFVWCKNTTFLFYLFWYFIKQVIECFRVFMLFMHTKNADAECWRRVCLLHRIINDRMEKSVKGRRFMHNLL